MESKHKLSINQWALEDRPREKMMEKGAAALSDAELLAILIGSGNTEESAVELMRRLLLSCDNNLYSLAKWEKNWLQASSFFYAETSCTTPGSQHT